MIMSKKELLNLARDKQFKPEILEKVLWLMQILQQFMATPYLRDRLVLKGGTALNLFQYENLPRLSVDIDLNYIGAIERSKMLEEKPVLNNVIYKILEENGLEYYRHPNTHAGSKMIWRYPSTLGHKGNLEIDLNYMYRQPLLGVEWKSPKLSIKNSFETATLDIHELAAGKLTALFSRRTSRDLFDAHYLLTQHPLFHDKLRLIFTVYLALSEIDFTQLTPNAIGYDLNDVNNQLIPLLRQDYFPKNKYEFKSWVDKIANELRDGLQILLPLKNQEKEFIQSIREDGIISPELITDDQEMNKKIKSHPAILWAVRKQNVNIA